jgi:hypothetical protein
MRKAQQPHEFFQPMEKESNSIPKSILIRYIMKSAPKNRYNEVGTNGADINKN